MIFGWIITFFFTFIIALNFAEVCSICPCSGSVYHWAAVLAPKPYNMKAAYWTGVFNLLGNIAGDASFAYIFAQFISASLVTAGADALKTTSLVALAIAVLLVWSVINCLRIEDVGIINNIAALIQILTVIALVIVVLSYAPKLNSTNYVFFTYNNDTGFSQQSYVIVLGALFSNYAFIGKSYITSN
jgi:amino acid transporter